MPQAFFQVKQNCPLCGAVFQTTRLRSSFSRAVKRHPDFHVTYKDKHNPLFYGATVCPKCHYASLDGSFKETVQPKFKEILKNTLAMSFKDAPEVTGERDFAGALFCYKLVFLCGEIMHQSAGNLAGIYLRCAWLCRDMELVDSEREYLDKARQLYLKAYESERHLPGKLTEPKLLYLVGELHRRLGLYSEAVAWFNRASVHPKVKMEPEVYRLVRDQWQFAREEFQKEKALAASGEAAVPLTEQKIPISMVLTGDMACWLSSIIHDDLLLEPERLAEVIEQVLLGLRDAGIKVHSGRVALVKDDIKALFK